MTLWEFKYLAATKSWEKFVLSPDDQRAITPIKARLTFHEMLVAPFGNHCVHFRRVKGDTTQSGDVLAIWCIESIDCEPLIVGDSITFNCTGGKKCVIWAKE